MRLQNKVAIITGQSRGLGKALSVAFKNEGAIVPRCTREQLDITNPGMIYPFINSVWKEHGGIDILINNAAVLGPVGPLLNVNPNDIASTILTDLFGPMVLSQGCIPALEASERGKIINICGGGTSDPLPRRIAYAVSKAGLARFSDTLAAEYPELDINAVLPGPLPTDMLDDIINAGPELLGETAYNFHRSFRQDADPLSIQKVVDLCVYLASDLSNGLSGKLISARHDNYAEWDVPSVMESKKYELRRTDDS